MITTSKIYKNKEEAAEALRKNYGKKSLDNIENFIKKFSDLNKIKYYYDSYIMITLISKYNPISNFFAVRYHAGKKIEWLTVFDLIKEKPEDFTPEYIYKTIFEDYKKKVKDVFKGPKSFCPSILYSYYIERQQYEQAAQIIGDILKKNKNTIYDFKTPYAYSGAVNQEKIHECESAFIYALTVIYGGTKYGKETFKSDYLGKYLNTIKELLTIADGGMPKVFDNPVIKYMHTYIERTYKSKLSKIRAKNFRNETHSNDIFECSERNCEYILSMFSEGPDDNRYYGIVRSRNDYNFRSYAIAFDKDKEKLIEMFKNYFYSKYGKGAKSERLEVRLYQFQQMINILGYEDEISIVDFVSDLPDKISSAALKGLVGGF